MTNKAMWDARYMELARVVGEWSKDRSRRVGCVIVGSDNEIRSLGYNGLPRGVAGRPEKRLVPPDKYLWTEHAERNAVYNAARLGTSTNGCTMYLTWFPCMDCARAIVQAGIQRLVASVPEKSDPRWGQHFKVAQELLKEARVKISWWKP